MRRSKEARIEKRDLRFALKKQATGPMKMEGGDKGTGPVHGENIAAGLGLRIGLEAEFRSFVQPMTRMAVCRVIQSNVDPNPNERRRMGNFLYPGAMLRAEGAALPLASVALYWFNGGGWLLFVLLLLSPDLSMLGYLAGVRAGAAIYNVFHAYPLPALLAIYSVFTEGGMILSLALIWLAHIGMDRMIGYGLKYPTNFKDTPLNRV